MTIKLISAFILAFLFATAFGKFYIPWLRKQKAGQEIKENGPTWHMAKTGTPTMGGVIFILAVTFVCLTIGLPSLVKGNWVHIFVLLFALVFGAIGFLDDWEKLKKKEKHMESYSATMEAVPKGFPALMRAAKIQKKAANVGFDWDNADQALYKLPEEVSELTKAMAEGNHAHIDEELGDVFFAAVNVARLLKRDPEQLLNAATDKFMTRFKVMEELITADSLSLEDMTLEKMDRYWDKAKKKLK